MLDEIFQAIRKSELLGKGSCSSVDECHTDAELKETIAEGLASGTYKTVQGALDWFVYLESVFWERQGMYETQWHEADAAREAAGRESYGG